MKHQIAAMLKAGSGGSIVNTASVGGTVAIPAHGEYIAAKHAVIGLTRIAAVDYGQQGIRVNAVLQCAIRNPMPHRKSVVSGKSVSGRVVLVGRRIFKKQ